MTVVFRLDVSIFITVYFASSNIISMLFQTWQSDEEDEESDLPFRQITEMTILTVQLIVEFAKGLPGFSKISQSDQITLLKVSSDYCFCFYHNQK